jgi:hypothetical protein
MPRFASVLLVILALAAAAVTAATGDSFLVELEDLPLAPGLREMPGGMLFDSAEGRIVEASATGAVPAEQVRSFYEATLPQLGWQKTGNMTFRRDKEGLRLIFENGPTLLTVHFTLTPTF